jgi:hypothetical protein
MLKSLSKLAAPTAFALIIAAGTSAASYGQASFFSTTVPTTPPIPTTPPPVVVQQPPPPTTPPPVRVTTTTVNIPNFTTNVVPTDITRLNLQVRTAQLPDKLDGYIFALATCQGIQDKNKGSIIYPVRGTLYTNDQKAGIKLARGRMLVIAADQSARVETNALTVVLEPGSSAIVETGLSGITRVFSTAAYEKSHHAATVSLANGGQKVQLSAGEAIIAADHDIENEELIPVDGIDQRPITGRIASLPSNVRLVEYSLKQMTNKNMLIACRPIDVHPSSKAGQALKQAHEQAVVAAEKQAPFAETKPVQTIVAQQSSKLADAAKANIDTQSFETLADDHSRSVLARRNSVCKINGDHIDLELGALLISSNSSTTINACGKVVSIKGATALVQSNGSSLKVINLTDKSSKSVSIIDGIQSLTLANGQEALFTKQAPTLADIFDAHKVGHRGLHSRDLGSNGWLTLSHINLQDALVHHPLLKQVHHARLNLSKKIVGQIMLTAAIMNTLGADKTSFQQGIPEDEGGTGAIIASHCSNCSL